MEQKHLLVSALGVGVGLGVGIGLASGRTAGKWAGTGSAITADKIEEEMMRLVVDGRESNVTFDQFPYYLSEQTRALLTGAAFVHLKQTGYSKHARNLSPASRTILLSGPAESYHQVLAKTLAHFFEAKFLLLDATEFSRKIQNKYGRATKETSFRTSISEAALDRLSGLLSSFSRLPPKPETKATLRRQRSVNNMISRGRELRDTSCNPPILRRNASASAYMENLTSEYAPLNQAPLPLKGTSGWPFDERQFIQALYKVLVAVSRVSPTVLYLRDVEKLLLGSQRIYNLFQKMLNNLTGSVLILGSQTMNPGSEHGEVDERLTALFPYNIEIKAPEDETHLVSWKAQLEEDMKMMQLQDTKNHILEVLAENDLDCDDLGSICMVDTLVLSDYIEEIVLSAISYHLMNNKNPEYRNGKLIISSKSLSHGLSIFQEGRPNKIDTSHLKPHAELPKEAEAGANVVVNTESKAESLVPENRSEETSPLVVAKKDCDNSLLPPKVLEPPPDNEFEKRIRPEVIPANEIGVTFTDIGAMDEIKESLQELVMLPLRRPDLFEGGLLKPCRGILLFGPPGTGKTMLAKAIAREAGASFINVSMSTITSKWFGEDEKNVRALFTLAAKVSPTIIFVDEVDSMLGQRSKAGENEAMRKIKNEFMTHWDGLLTRPGEQILVLAATNRPFDLDEAIIRRFERRVMVGLPTMENREMILKTLLSKESVSEGLDLKEIAAMTEGYSGSDIKNLCTTAAYRPVRELIKQEMLKDMERKKRAEGKNLEDDLKAKEGEETRVVVRRPLNMEDFRQAKNQVAASFSAEGSIMNELKQWNDLFGEGGSRKKEQLTYFL